MKDIYKLIMENVLDGKLEKQAAKQLMKMLKQEHKEIERDIAIIGISIKFPMADDIHGFWSNIRNKVDCIGELPKNRKVDADNFLNMLNVPQKNIKYVEAAYLKDLDKFDNNFFRISPKEANMMEPSQRLFLEVGFEAIEDSGYGGEALKGSNTGVYVGYSSDLRTNYAKLLLESNTPSLEVAIPGNLASLIPNRLSFFLDLKGPSMIIQTACSSSLVAVHTACKALRNEECDMAIAGGVKIDILPLESEFKMGIEAEDGRTKAFDDRGDGSGVGEGIAAIVLKPLNKAIEDGDNIYAVIKGSCINQDGTAASITVPNVESQKEVVIKAWESARINPETISYIEAHGTGTKLGDPIEIDGITAAFKQYTDKKQFCAISSIKTNMGHLYESAGVAGLVKAIMALQYRELPPMIHFERPNARINFVNSPIYINTKLRKWKTKDYPRRCGVSSFGIGGTNCHVVLEEAPKVERKSLSNNEKLKLLALSAKNENALKELANKYIENFNKIKQFDLEDICYTANTGRGHYNCRVALLVKNHDEFKKMLNVIKRGNFEGIDSPQIYYGKHDIVSASKKVLGKEEITEETKIRLNVSAKSKLTSFIKENKKDNDALKDICNLYIQGADIEWKDLYYGEDVRRVSIPTYPFEKNRCWIEFSNAKKEERKQLTNADSFYSNIRWVAKRLQINDKSMEHKSILIFKDMLGLGAELATRLKGEGKNVIEVEFGEVFEKLGTDKYMITGKEEEYEKLMKELECEELSQILHMSSIAEKDNINSVEELDEELNTGVMSLFLLIKAIGKNNLKQAMDIILVGKNAYEVTKKEEYLKPTNATLFGLSKTISNEYSNLKCRCIDIDEQLSCDELIAELKNGQNTFNIAYRNGVRYIEEISSVNIMDFSENNISIKEGGIYIITGGTGGIGLEVCKYLASKNKVKLALINRSILPPREQWDEIIKRAENKKICRAIETIIEIEENGSQVTCYSEDITNTSNMRRILNTLREKYGRINGIIHGAGIAGDGFIFSKKYETFKKVLLPKVHGTWILNHLTQSDNLDFFIMFSSEASILGLPGQGDYTAANSYMDSFSEYRNKKGYKTLAINWPIWNETGMSVDNGVDMNTIFKSISTKQGIETFEELLKRNIARVIVGEWNYNEEILNILQTNLSLEVKKKMKVLKEHAQPDKNKEKKSISVRLKGREDGSYSETEKMIAQAWAEVLGFEELNIYDSFYELGGDSLLAFKLVNNISKLLNRDINIAEIFNFTSIFDFASYLDGSGFEEEDMDNFINTDDIGKKEAYFPISLAQKKIFMSNNIEDTKFNHNSPLIYIVEGHLSVNRLENALNKIVNRHEILRTYFEFMDGDIFQKIHEELKITISHKKVEDTDILSMVQAFIERFDLNSAPLLRMEVVEFAREKSLIMIDISNVIADYMSKNLLVKELVSIYEGNELMPLKLQYKDFVLWQNEFLKSNSIMQQENYWLRVFEEEIPLLNLPYDFLPTALQNSEVNTFEFVIDRMLTTDIKTLISKTDTTMYMLLLAVYTVLLYKYSGQQDIVVGFPITGRDYEELNYIIGVFENTLAIRSYPLGTKKFCDFLQEVKTNFLKAYENKDCQLEELINKFNISGDSCKNKLFNTKFSLLNMESSEITATEAKFSQYKMNRKNCNFDLAIEAKEKSGEILITIEYSVDLFKMKTIERIAHDFTNIIRNITKKPMIELNLIGSVSYK